MNTGLLVLAVLVLFGLIKSTENLVNIRQHRRDEGEELKTYL